MKQALIIALASTLLHVGCAPQKPIIKKTFYGEPRSLESIAIIKRSEEKAEFLATIAQYSPPPLWLALKELEPNTVELHLDPGEYVLVLHCAGVNSYAQPRTTIRARAGTTYEVACERNTFTGHEVRAKVSTSYPNVPVRPPLGSDS